MKKLNQLLDEAFQEEENNKEQILKNFLSHDFAQENEETRDLFLKFFLEILPNEKVNILVLILYKTLEKRETRKEQDHFLKDIMNEERDDISGIF